MNDAQSAGDAAPLELRIDAKTYLSADGTYAATSTPLRSQSLTLDYTKVLNANTVNEARGGVVRWVIDISPLGNPFNTASAVGIPGINVNNYSGGLPALAITGFQVLGDNSTYPEFSRMTIFQFEDNLTMVRGSHTFKFGAQFLRDRFNGYSAFPTRGSYTFNGQFTRQAGSSTSITALSDFALGAPSGLTRNILTSEFGMRMWSFSSYAQDAWRVNNRLTLTYGLRWEISAPPYEVHDHWSNFDFKTTQLALAGKNGYNSALRNIDFHAFAGRSRVFRFSGGLLTREQDATKHVDAHHNHA